MVALGRVGVPLATQPALLVAIYVVGWARCAHADDSLVPEKIAVWGDPNFWVQLKYIRTSEGVMTPEFKPDVTDYEVKVSNPMTKQIVFFLGLNLQKYDLLHCPEIRFRGNTIDYKPIDGITVYLPLNETINPYDKIIPIEVADPNPQSGWFARQAKITYNFRVLQPPDFEDIVDLKELTIQDEMGHVIDSDQPMHLQTHKAQFLYKIEKNVTEVKVKAVCHRHASSMTFDGEVVNRGETIAVKTRLGESQVLIQCQYEDDMWTNGLKLQRTYVLTFRKKLHLSETNVELVGVEPKAHCELKDHQDRHKGFDCALERETVELVAISDNNMALMTMEPTGVGLPSGLPVAFYVPSAEDRELTLVLRLGTETQKFPVSLFWPSGCPGIKCPEGLQPIRGKDVKCKKKQCTKEDIPRCCEKVIEGTCVTHTCPAEYEHVPHADKLLCSRDRGVIKCTDEQCCLRVCDSVQCPPRWQHIRNADVIRCDPKVAKNCTASHCCERVCNSVDCPAHWQHVPNADVRKCDDVKAKNCTIPLCCERRCSNMDCGECGLHTPYANRILCSRGAEDHCHKDRCCDPLPNCTGFLCPYGTSLRAQPEHLCCFGDKCTEEDTSRCCGTPANCEGFQCPAPAMKLKRLALYIACATEVCTEQDTMACCRSVDNCGNFKCPKGKVQKESAAKIQCDTEQCIESDEDLCCVEAATCGNFTCPRCRERRENATDLLCPHPVCTARDCCVGTGWILGEPGQTCTEACAPAGGCIEDDSAWPDTEKEFRHIMHEAGVDCEIIQPGESGYDPSISGEKHCGSKAYKLDPDLEKLPMYSSIRCDSKPPPQTQRFCICGLHGSSKVGNGTCGEPGDGLAHQNIIHT